MELNRSDERSDIKTAGKVDKNCREVLINRNIRQDMLK